MKSPSISIILRNSIVAAIFLCLLIVGSTFFPFKYVPRGLTVLLLLLAGVLWANRPLMKRRPVLTILLSLALVPAVAALCSIISIPLSRRFVEQSYQTDGFQMVNGCNGGAAVEANGQVHNIKNYLAHLKNSPSTGTNDIAELENALRIAEEKARVLNEDCGRRGHCENKPWKTNWAKVKETLAFYEQRTFGH